MMKNKKVLREILSDGGAVVLPTETVYGLFAKALDESAVNHVYELKNRPSIGQLKVQIDKLMPFSYVFIVSPFYYYQML